MEHETQHHTATFEKNQRHPGPHRGEAGKSRSGDGGATEEKAALEMKKTREEEKRLQKEIDKKMKELQGLFTSQWGKLMESLVEGDLVALLQARGIEVESTHSRSSGRRNGEHYEF